MGGDFPSPCMGGGRGTALARARETTLNRFVKMASLPGSMSY